METYNFTRNYDCIESLLEISESDFGRDASEIIMMDDAQIEIPISDVILDGIYLEPGNSSEITIQERQPSAFSLYRKSQSNAATDSLVSCETLHKRCFRFLRKMNEDRQLEIQRSRRTASSASDHGNKQELKEKKKDQAKSAFHHMIAERNRRVKLNERLQNLYSLLPRNCKKDKHSILANATDYLKELKLRVLELEQQSESVDESIQKISSNSCEEGSPGFESHDNRFISENLLLYRSDDVVLQQCDDSPCHFKITINVQKKVSCSASLLVRVLDLLIEEQLDIISVSHKRGSGFHATLAVFQKGVEWDLSHWQTFGRLVSRTVN